MIYQETFVHRNGHRIYVREYPGAETTGILLHECANLSYEEIRAVLIVANLQARDAYCASGGIRGALQFSCKRNGHVEESPIRSDVVDVACANRM